MASLPNIPNTSEMAFLGNSNGLVYQDEDGIANLQSQATYTARVKNLQLLTCALSSMGFVAAVSGRHYTAKNIELLLSLSISESLTYSVSHMLWVSTLLFY